MTANDFHLQNDIMYKSIILGDWYLLTCSDQMLYKVLMLNLQKTKALSIGGVAPLNMISCVSVKSMIKLTFFVTFFPQISDALDFYLYRSSRKSTRT